MPWCYSLNSVLQCAAHWIVLRSMPSLYISHSGDSSRSLATVRFSVVDRVVDLFLGREAADGEAQDRAVRQLVAAAERAQHVARLQAGRGAGRAGRHRDVLDRHDQRLALDEVEADVQVVRHALLEVAVDVDLLDVRQAVEQAVAAACGCARSRLPISSLGDAEGLAHADDLVRRQRARAHAALVAAAVHLRFERTRGLRRTYSAPMPFGP